MTFNALDIGDYFQYEHVPGRLYRKRTKGTAVIVGAPCEETGRTWVRFTKDTNVTRVTK